MVILDDDFGPAFIKLCSYFLYPGEVWVNGHEWARRQADRAELDYTALADGFASCTDPTQLEQICDVSLNATTHGRARSPDLNQVDLAWTG